MIRTGRVTEPVAPLTVSRSPSATPEPRGGVRRRSGPPAGGRCRPARARRAAGCRRRAAAARRRARASPAASVGRRRAARTSSPTPSPRTAGGAQGGELGAGRLGAWAAAGRRPSRRPGPAAPGRRAAAPVPCRVASNGADPALPVEVAAGLLRRRGDREDDVGPLGDRATGTSPG